MQRGDRALGGDLLQSLRTGDGTAAGHLRPGTPAVCPATATCAPPGTNLGGTEYGCQWCEGSGAIIEQFFPSNGPPQTYPSNACMRH